MEVHLRAHGATADNLRMAVEFARWLANRSSLTIQASEGWRGVWDDFPNWLIRAA